MTLHLRLCVSKGGHALDQTLSQEVQAALAGLERLDRETLDIAKKLFAVGRPLYPLDLLAAAVMNRSLCLISGFRKLMEDRNFVAAAPLLRLQIDNCLRFFAAGLSGDTDSFALKVLQGDEIRKLKAQDGKKMVDSYLVDRIGEHYPWIPSVYKATSGYIHLSEKHMFASFSSVDSNERTIGINVKRADTFIPDELYLECIEAFAEGTKVLLDLCTRGTKQNGTRTMYLLGSTHNTGAAQDG